MKNLKIDFHLHTIDDPEDNHVRHTSLELIDHASNHQFDAISITLHNAQFNQNYVHEYAAKKNILLIPGMEKTIEGAHVLLINFPLEVLAVINTFSDLRIQKKIIQENGFDECLIIAAHPFFPHSVSLLGMFWENVDLFDAIEFSGFYHSLWNPNKKALNASKVTGLPVIANSDTHTLQQFGKTWTEVHCAKNADEIIRSIKKGKLAIKTRPLNIFEFTAIGFKVIFLGYVRVVNYKKIRKWIPVE